jgi:uncharacterized protein YecE (DUF72 family)
MIAVGTSGFSYEDWKGHFYPPKMGKTSFLEYYSNYFDACEINATYYSPPTTRMTEGLLRKSRGRVTFSIKANRRMTHEQDADDAFFSGFVEALRPIEEAGRLGAVLAQFPQSLKPDRHGKDVVERIYEGLRGLPLVFEFRHARWAHKRVFDWMSGRDIGLCCVDEPPIRGLFPPIVKVTSRKIAYLRFHGRNAQKWHEHEQAYERYDYLYSESELREWLPKIGRLADEAEKVFVFYNNHFQAKAVENAMQLKALLQAPVQQI